MRRLVFHAFAALSLLALPAASEVITHPREVIDYAAVEQGYSDEPRFMFFLGNGAATPGKEGEAIARAAYSIWQESGHPSLVIIGHADDIGGEEFNLKLGMRRAVKTFDLLKKFEGDIRRIAMVSGGEAHSLVPVVGEGQEAHNRRVEIFVSDNNWRDMQINWLDLSTPDQEDREILEHVLGKSRVGPGTVSARVVDPADGRTVIFYQSDDRCLAACVTGVLREEEEAWKSILSGPSGSDIELSRETPIEVSYWTSQADRYCRRSLVLGDELLELPASDLCVFRRTEFVPLHRALVGTWSSTGDCSKKGSVSLRENGSAHWMGQAAMWNVLDGHLVVTRAEDQIADVTVSAIEIDTFAGIIDGEVIEYRDCLFGQ